MSADSRVSLVGREGGVGRGEQEEGRLKGEGEKIVADKTVIQASSYIHTYTLYMQNMYIHACLGYVTNLFEVQRVANVIGMI